VAVQEQVASRRRDGGRDVDEVAAGAGDFAFQGERPVVVVVVAEDDVQRFAELLERGENVGRANVAEVPDFVRMGDAGRELRREAVVCVGDYCDAHVEEFFNLAEIGGLCVVSVTNNGAW